MSKPVAKIIAASRTRSRNARSSGSTCATRRPARSPHKPDARFRQGLDDLYTDLKNPDCGKVAEALGLWGRAVDKADELEEAIQTWPALPGPAPLNVRVQPQQLVMPPYLDAGAVMGMTLYFARPILVGRGGDVLEMIKENFL